MKKIKGITLISLVVTVSVLIILSSITIYSGVSVIESSKLTAFITQMKIMQTQVNSIYEKYKNDEKIEIGGTYYDISEIESDTTSTIQTKKDKIFEELEKDSGSGIYPTEKEKYKYWDNELVKDLGIEGVDLSFFINIEKRNIISYEGFNYNGKTYYTLSQLPDSLYNVEYDETSIVDVDAAVEEDLLIYPGNTQEVPFTIKNYNKNNVNKIETEYYINIDIINSEFPLDSEYKIYDITNGEEREITKIDGKGYGPIQLNYLEKEDRNFKVVFSWTIDSNLTNNVISHANKACNFNIRVSTTGSNKEITSKTIQMRSYPCELLTAEITEIEDGQDNTFRVKITNSNVFEIRCIIKGDQGYKVVYDNTEDEKEIVIGPNDSRTITVTFTSLDTELYDEAKRDENGRLYTLFDMWVNASNPYNGNERVISEDVKIYLKDTIKNIIVANADNITEYEEGHVFTGVSGADEGDLCSIIDPVIKKREYFYRGNVTNNYVNFAGQTWRILRINEDGSLRLILDGVLPTTTKYGEISVPTEYNIENAIEILDWESSICNQTLHTYYNENIANNENYSKYVVKTKFVFDTEYTEETSSSTGGSTYYFATYKRIGADGNTFAPTFSYTEDSLIEDYIGTITGDEVVYAGGYWHANSTFFLANASIPDYYWTMSPSFWDNGSHHIAEVMMLDRNGYLKDWYSPSQLATELYCRPVISIRGDIHMAGSGTSDDPYHYVENIGDGI